MIKYALTCDRSHAFDSWFRDSAAFDSLAQQGQVACPTCGSASVRKAMMAPALVRGRAIVAPEVTSSAPAATPAPSPEGEVALVDDGAKRLRDLARELRRAMTEGADDVGRAFPDEARRIHGGEAPHRAIYGQASGEDVRALLEDGIPLMPLPSLPDDKH